MTIADLRFLYDCEKLEKVLQYRKKDPWGKLSEWITVPTIYNTVDLLDEVDDDGKK